MSIAKTSRPVLTPVDIQLENIINGCKAANRESQQSFYKYFYVFSYTACIFYCQGKEEARQAVNEGFLKVFRDLLNINSRFDKSEAAVRSWIKKIMIYTAIDRYRKNKKNSFLNEMNDHPFEFVGIEQNAIHKLSYDEVIELVHQLSPAFRIVFTLYVIHGFKHEEIAEELNITVETSWSNLARARQQIQKMLASKLLPDKSHLQQRNKIMCEA
jgi:RNA polymerase sigma-70 factor, ECF subfamily